MADVITRQGLEDAKEDADDLAQFMNGAVDLNGDGTFTNRDGDTIKTLARIVQDIYETDVDGPLAAGLDARLDILEDIQVKPCAVLSYAGDQINLQSAYNTGSTAWSEYTLYRFRLTGAFTGLATTAPTATLNGGAALPIYNADLNAVDKQQFVPNDMIMMLYNSTGGGLLRVVYPQKYDGSAPVLLVEDTAHETAAENAYLLRSRNGNFSPNNRQRYQCRFYTTNQTVPFTFSVNGGTPRVVYEWDGTNPRPGRIQGGKVLLGVEQLGPLYTFEYIPVGDPLAVAGAPYFLLVDPPMDQNERVARTALQVAGQSMRALQKRWEDDNLTAFNAIPRSVTFNHSFAAAGDEGKYIAATSVGGPGDYLPYNHHGDGYIYRDMEADGGLFRDPNHTNPGPGYMGLPLIIGPAWNSALVGKNMTNGILDIRLRFINFVLPPEVVLAWHFQGTTNLGGSWGTSALNFIYLGQFVSDAAGFGMSPRAGLGWPPTRRSIADTGWVDFRVNLIPDDAYWMCLGSSWARAEDDAGPGTDTYGIDSIRTAMAGTFNTMILVAWYPQQQSPTAPPQQGLVGEIRVDSCSLSLPT